MFKALVNIPSSFYAFVSGIFITISTTAASQIIFSEITPNNTNLLITIGVITFLASVLWIYLSEIVTNTNILIDKNAETINSKKWQKRLIAIDAVKKDECYKIYTIFITAIFFSILWIIVYIVCKFT